MVLENKYIVITSQGIEHSPVETPTILHKNVIPKDIQEKLLKNI